MVDNGRQRSTRSDIAQDINNDPHGDPLAELARLIGQDDLFDQMKKDTVRSEMRAAMSPRAPAPQEPEWGYPDASTADLRRSFDELGHDVESPPRRTETSYPHGDPLAGDYATPPRRTSAAREERIEAPARQAPVPRQQDYSYDEDRYSLRDERDTGYEHRHVAASSFADPHAGYGRQEAPTYAEPLAAAPSAAYEAPQQASGYYDEYPQQPDQRTYDGAYAQNSGYEEPYEESYEEAPPARRRSGMMAVAAVVGLAVIGTAGAFGYRAITGSGSSGQPPVIKADNAPAKVVPPPQDGQASKLNFDRAAPAQGERVVSREEQPIDLKAATAPKTVTTTTVAATGSTGVPAQVAAYAPSSTGLSAGVEPKKVRTIAIRPETAQTPSGPTRSAAVPQPPPAPTRTASIPPAAVPAAPPAGSYVVQLVSNKSENEAQAAFKGLQAKYPSVLGSRQALIRRVDLGDKGTYYRAQVGPFASVDQANDLCGNLKAAGGQCIVQRN